MIATHELVVPRSIPITSPTSLDLNLRVTENDESKNETGKARADNAATDDDDVKADRRSKRDEVDSIVKSISSYLINVKSSADGLLGQVLDGCERVDGKEGGGRETCTLWPFKFSRKIVDQLRRPSSDFAVLAGPRHRTGGRRKTPDIVCTMRGADVHTGLGGREWETNQGFACLRVRLRRLSMSPESNQ